MQLFTRLLQRPVQTLQRLTEGRNSRVYRIRCSPSEGYIGKLYFQNPCDSRDRLGVEYQSFVFLHQHQITVVPRPICIDRASACAIYEEVQGRKLAPTEIQNTHVIQCTDFLQNINQLRHLSTSQALPSASEACFSLAQFIANIEQRLERLQGLQSSLPVYQQLRTFLNQQVIPFLQKHAARAATKYEQFGYARTTLLPQQERILSPSDFGFHNALVSDEDQLFFVDFEYFGWDDPVKTIADFLLHPAMLLTEAQKQLFTTVLLSHFEIPTWRLHVLYPLVGIKWIMILLNEFILSDRARREFSLGESEDISLVCAQQLLKSRSLLQSLQTHPYGP